jgi:hypothetical protein
MSGGGNYKKHVVNFLVDKPFHAFIGGGYFLWTLRQLKARQAYCEKFGTFDFQRRNESGEFRFGA